MQLQMYAHPKRHLPQTETKDKEQQTNMQARMHNEFLSVTWGNGQALDAQQFRWRVTSKN